MPTSDPPSPPGAPHSGDPPPVGKKKRKSTTRAPKALRRRGGRPPFRSNVLRERGRPSKYCDEIARSIVGSLRMGCSARAASGEHGISEKTLSLWAQKNLPYRTETGEELFFGTEVRRAQHGSEAKLTRKWFELCEAAQSKDWRAVQGLLQVINRDRFGPPAREDQSAPVLLPSSTGLGDTGAGPVIRFFLPALIDEPGTVRAPPPPPPVEDVEPASGPREHVPPTMPPAPATAQERPIAAPTLPFIVAPAPAPPAEPPPPVEPPVPPPDPSPASPPGHAIPPWMRKPRA